MAQVRGAFPYPFAQPQDGGGVITLGGGGTFYFPSGEWLISLPASNMVFEWWNPLATSWVTVSNASDYISSDGYNLRLRNTTASVSAVAGTAGSGGTNGIGFAATGAAVTFSAPGTGGITATAYAIVGGTVAAPTVTQAGTGFAFPPLVVIDPPPVGGIQATAVAALTAGGGIASVTIVNAGAGYAASPNFYLIPQTAFYQGGPSGGAAAAPIQVPGLVNPVNAVAGNQNTAGGLLGALLTPNALTGSGTLTGIVMINGGTVYPTTLTTVTVTGVTSATGTITQATASANATAFAQPRVQ